MKASEIGMVTLMQKRTAGLDGRSRAHRGRLHLRENASALFNRALEEVANASVRPARACVPP
jgi:hypothetical protein